MEKLERVQREEMVGLCWRRRRMGAKRMEGVQSAFGRKSRRNPCQGLVAVSMRTAWPRSLRDLEIHKKRGKGWDLYEWGLCVNVKSGRCDRAHP